MAKRRKVHTPDIFLPNLPYGGMAPHGDTDTSIEAAIKVTPRVSDLQRTVLDFLRLQGEHGATDEEIAEATGLYLYTSAPRRGELCINGYVEDSGDRRCTVRGRRAIVWRIKKDAVLQQV